MPLHSASYFAGVGTVVVTMAIGFGGGVMLTDAFVGKSERTPTLLERRAAPPSQSAPVVAVAPAAQQDSLPRVITPTQQSASAQQSPVDEPQPPAQPAAPSPAEQQQARAEQSMGQAREHDLKQQDANTRKTIAAERRKQERRKWAERRKREMEKVDELTAVSEKVKHMERQREPVLRSFAAESPSPPMIPLFGNDDDD